MSDEPKTLAGRKPGDRRVRIERPQASYFRYAGPGMLVARPKAHEPRGVLARTAAHLRHVVIGRPLANEEEIEERLSKKKALAIFSSDAISSSAYATEEILRVLLVGGLALLALSLPISLAIALLLGVVAFSYRQVCLAYPTGGGSYSVSKENLGRLASLVAASALLIDYTLTVAVSISSAVEQIGSALPFLEGHLVLLAVIAVALITLGNLRGIRESGNIFALPTYLFVGSALLMIVMGAYRAIVEGGATPLPPPTIGPEELTGTALLVLVLRAFASGSVALTGTEAIATGVPAFKPPEARNAATTLLVMAVLLGILFVGITFLAFVFGITPGDQTVLAQVSSTVFGANSIGFYSFQTFAALLLMLAANTSFAAFPRLAAVLSQDGFFPRQFAFRGERLAFTGGILLLGVVAGVLIVAFDADTHALIPLYAVGVFIDFTISQTGMVRHWLRLRGGGWRTRLAINTTGALLTATVAIVVTVVKAPSSLMVLALIPLLIGMMLFINREYRQVSSELEVRPDVVFKPPHRRERVIVPVPGLSRAVIQAVQFARSLTEDVRAVHLTDDPEQAAAFRARWERQVPGVPLVIVESPYRSLTLPFLAYLDVMAPAEPGVITIVVLPEYVPRHWWDKLLYNQNANRLRRALLGRPDTVVANVPYRREARPRTGRIGEV